jgi:hypothetical protein
MSPLPAHDQFINTSSTAIIRSSNSLPPVTNAPFLPFHIAPGFLTEAKNRAEEVNDNLVKQEAYLKRRLTSHEANLEDLLNANGA